MNKNDKPDDLTAPAIWDLAAYHNSSLTYSFTGYRNSSALPQYIRFNFTQCASPSLALYNGTLLQAYTSFWPNMSLVTEPRVSGTFSNASALLEIKGVYQGRSVGGNSLGGNMTITFNGTIDEARSDRLMSNTRGSTPFWQSTLGYEKTLTGERPADQIGAGTRLGMMSNWIVGIVVLMVLCGL